MTQANCRLPICQFNCCDSKGQCPSSKNECDIISKKYLYIYIVVGVIVLILIVAGLILLRFTKNKKKQEEELKQFKDLDMQVSVAKEIQLPLKESVPTLKKNIYVYERSVILNTEKQQLKSPKSQKGRKYSKDSIYNNRNKYNKSVNSSIADDTDENPFEKKKSFRRPLL